MKDKITVFILTHGRPDNIKTLASLEKAGYTGEIYFIVDNEDKTLDRYIEKFGEDKVKVFDKKFYADQMDEANNFDERRAIVFARNACFDIAESLGITYFMQLDDDYTSFYYRLIIEGEAVVVPIKNLDSCLRMYLDFYIKSGVTSLAMAQGGDFLGGLDNGITVAYRLNKRKCMNSFICSTKRRFQFLGAINEDVNTYTTLATRGTIFLTAPFISLTQAATQKQKSGMSDAYKKLGTYVKSFTSILMHPSGVKAYMMPSNHRRIHHTIKWKNTIPCIISEKHKKYVNEKSK